MEQEELKRMRQLVFKKGSGSKLYDLNLEVWVWNTLYTNIFICRFLIFCVKLWAISVPHVLNEKFEENDYFL